MPSCLAFGCANTNGRSVEVSFYRIPDPKKDKARAARWLHNMGNSTWKISNFVATKDRVVCSDHFHPDCFKRDLKFELLPQTSQAKKKKRKELVPGAVPSVFVHKVYEEINMDGTKVASTPAASRKRTLELERTQVNNYCLVLCNIVVFLI